MSPDIDKCGVEEKHNYTDAAISLLFNHIVYHPVIWGILLGKEMLMSNTPTIAPQNSSAILEELWLTYFNDTLYSSGLITEDERNKMHLLIRRRSQQKKAIR